MRDNPANRTLEELAENPYLEMIPKAVSCYWGGDQPNPMRDLAGIGNPFSFVSSGMGLHEDIRPPITGFQPHTPNTGFIHSPLPMSDLQSFASIHRPNPDNSYFMTTGLEQRGSSFQVKDNWGYVPSYKEQQRDNSIQLDLLQRWADPDYRPKFKMY